MLKKSLLTASVVCVFMVIPSVAAAAQLDGETLTGTARGVPTCTDNGDGTSSVSLSRRGGYQGVAAGPVVGTFVRGRVDTTFDSATGVVTDFNADATIVPADGTAAFGVAIDLGSGQGVATCAPDGSWTLNVTGATYTTATDTGTVSVSATYVSATGVSTFTAVFGPQLPTSKAQCDKDGWQTFPGFKNQGDCVSYVASKGKNKPAGS